MTTAPHYNRPPIVEAIIELKYDGPLTEKEFERLRDRFKKDYPTVEDRTTISVEVQADGKFSTTSQPAGFKMTAKNAIDVILINEASFGTVRLAPYEKWENLQTAAEQNFELFTKTIGRKKIIRIGTRFMNRIDVPKSKIEGNPISDFLSVGVVMPPNISKVITDFSLAFAGDEVSTGAKVIINCGIVPPALIDHTSINLDIDVYWDTEIPGRIDDLWKKTSLLRDAKNAVFEKSITDKVRELFQ